MFKQKRILLFSISAIFFLIYLTVLVFTWKTVIKSEKNSGESSSREGQQFFKYSDPKGFEYDYPEEWTYAQSREGIGLIPKEICKIDCSREILTIGARITDKVAMDPKELTLAQFGLGFTTGEYVEINKLPAFYAIFQRDTFTDITYTIVGKNLFVQTKFRVELREGIDTSKYKDDAELIVRSIKFN